jgi:hypothetical protein
MLPSRRFVLFAALLLCLKPPGAMGQDPGKLTWSPRFRGVSSAQFTLNEPRLIHAFVLRIDLQEPGVQFFATPGNGPKESETDGLKTSTFLTKYKLQAAINAAPFAPVAWQEGAPKDVSGLAVSQGEIVSQAAATETHPALFLTREKKAWIASPPFAGVDKVWIAVSGFHVVLKGGTVIAGKPDLHPRTAAGLTRDGALMFWLVIDGRQASWSGGATTQETGQLLQKLGCWSGINLDGGGTSTLTVQGPDGKARILNRPIHAGIPGMERVSGSHLGIKAETLPAKQ